jgi:hypothetical protein
MGRDHIPPSIPYSRQSSQSSRVNMTQNRGAYLPYQPTPGPWDESPYIQDSDSSVWSSWRNDGALQGQHRPSPSSQPRVGRIGAPFYSQGPDPIHVSMCQIMSEIKRLSVRVTNLEAEAQRTRTSEQFLGHLKMIDARLSALEDGVADISGVQERKVLRGGSNNHLSLKVSHY